MSDQVIWLDKLGMNDVDRVGGKNASLGEMISKLSALGVSVPGGFATTAKAYRQFLRHGGLARYQRCCCPGRRRCRDPRLGD